MLSGLHSHQTMTRGFTELERIGPAMPDLLKENGYYIANINKQQDYYDWDKAVMEETTSMGRDIPANIAALEGIIEDAGSKPWFIMMNFNDPHRPFYDSEYERQHEKFAALRKQGTMSTPSKVFTPDEIRVPGFLPNLPEVRREMAEYYSSVRRCDDGVGALMKLLKDKGLEENTIVVFLSDHGISMPYSKLNCYQTSLRVPLIFRYPPQIGAGQRDALSVVSTIDLAPTLLELAGIEVPGHMVGRSFVPLLEGASQEGRDYMVGYYYRNLRQTNMFPEFTIQMKDWVYIYNPWVDGRKEVHNSDYTQSETLAAIWAAADTVPSIKLRSDFHKYRIIEELYNVRKDPHEYINLAYDPEFAPRVAAMRAILVDWMATTDHPALELMKDPYNQELIDAYMQYEKNTAREEIDELVAIRKGKEKNQ
jgi:N-sulfoglucosamine sulfohydrolase